MPPSKTPKPAPPAGKKRGRGRPPKAPKVKVPAAPAPPAQITTADAMLLLLAEAKDRAAKRLPLANHHQRILRDAWLLDMNQYLWEGATAAAADLGFSVGTFRSFREKGCPGIEDHSPIPKHTVLAWLLKNAHDRGGERNATTDDIEKVELQIKQVKAAKGSGELISEAQDRANQGVIRLMGQLRSFFQNGLPALVYELAFKHPSDRAAGEDAISQAIDTELRRFEPGSATTPATMSGAQIQEPTP